MEGRFLWAEFQMECPDAPRCCHDDNVLGVYDLSTVDLRHCNVPNTKTLKDYIIMLISLHPEG